MAKSNQNKATRKRGRPPKPKKDIEAPGVCVVKNDAPAPAPAPKTPHFNVLYHETIPRATFRDWLVLALHSEREQGRSFVGAVESNHVAFVMFEAKAQNASKA